MPAKLSYLHNNANIIHAVAEIVLNRLDMSHIAVVIEWARDRLQTTSAPIEHALQDQPGPRPSNSAYGLSCLGRDSQFSPWAHFDASNRMRRHYVSA